MSPPSHNATLNDLVCYLFSFVPFTFLVLICLLVPLSCLLSFFLCAAMLLSLAREINFSFFFFRPVTPTNRKRLFAEYNTSPDFRGNPEYRDEGHYKYVPPTYPLLLSLSHLSRVHAFLPLRISLVFPPAMPAHSFVFLFSSRAV